MHRRRRYNRPEQLWKHFFIEGREQTPNERGRVVGSYLTDDAEPFLAILCGANPEQQSQFKQLGHTISHVISHEGEPKAKEGDRLISGNKVYLIRSIDNPGEMGLWTLYYCDERKDIQDGG